MKPQNCNQYPIEQLALNFFLLLIHHILMGPKLLLNNLKPHYLLNLILIPFKNILNHKQRVTNIILRSST
jgi:hypothetical protein